MTDPLSPFNADHPPRRQRRERLHMLDDPARVIRAKHPRCRKCSSIDLETKRTLTEYGDGDTVYRRVACRACGDAWILELM